jgi:uncharacterized protein YoxC
MKKEVKSMSTAKEIIVNKLEYISDDVQDEFEVLDDLYKLLKLEKSRASVKSEGTFSTTEVREHFAEKHAKTGTLV